MKKFTYLSMLFLIGNLTFGQVTDLFSAQVSDYEIVAKTPYSIIKSNKSTGYTTMVGAPQLPVYSRKYVLPLGSTVTGMTYSNGSKTLIGSMLYIYPSQPTCTPNGKPCPDFVPPDPILYNSNSPFPIETTTLSGDVSTFGYHVVSVEICPFQYIPQEKNLYLYNEINFSIQYSVGQVNYQVRITERRNQLTKDFVRTSVQNPELITPNARTANQIVVNQTTTDKLVIPWKPSNYGIVPDYVIITNNTLKSKFQTLASNKIEKGISTVVATVEDIYKNYPGCDNAEKVRNYLKAANHYWGQGLAVLLGGDTAIVPGRMAVRNLVNLTSFEWNYTDLYFCDIFKDSPGYTWETDNYNWNTDGDGDFAWDESPTLLDQGPDNIIGRAPVDTMEEAENFVNKIIAYENPQQNLDTSYFKNMLFLGSYYDYDQDTETPMILAPPNYGGQEWHFNLAQQPFLADSSFKKWLLFDDYPGFPHGFPGDDELNKIKAMNCLNLGKSSIGKFHLVSHYDHGSPFGIGVSSAMKGDALSRNDADGLSNGKYYQIMYSTACEDGTFQKDCFAEHYVNAANGGGVAMIANSGSVPPKSLAQDIALFQSIYDETQPETSSIMGVAFAHARDAIYAGNENHNKQKHLTLFGEPTMAIWSSALGYITVSAPPSLTINNVIANILPVTISPIQNEATVTLYKYNSITGFIEVYASKNIPAGGNSAEFIVNPDTSGFLQVKVTAKNYRPAKAFVDIMMPQPHLYITNYTITDSNGNGTIEQGETINLSVSITNSGNTYIGGVNTTLSCLPIFATITNNQVGYPQVINAGQTITLDGFSFVAQVEQPSQPLPNFIEFMLNITADGNYIHLDSFYPELKSPKLILGARNLTTDAVDTTIKNLNVFLNNAGNVDTGILTATLSSPMVTDGIIQITNAIRTYPNIEALTEQKNSESFVFKFLQPHSGPQPFTITLTALTNGLFRTWSFNFDLNEELPLLISGFKFTSTTDQITLKWNAIPNQTNGSPSINGYNIYRSDTLNGNYVKINDFLVTGSSTYTDFDVNPNDMSIYYYKISIVSLTGNEKPLENIVTDNNPPLAGYRAWTKLGNSSGFPIIADLATNGIGYSSPTLFDVDNNGSKEIFVNYANTSEDDGKIMGFYNTGQEMFNIDGDVNTVSGFASTDISMVTNAAVGDLDKDGFAEVLSVGRDNLDNRGKVYVYKTIDADGDNKPDKFWNDEVIDVGWKINTNPVLYDVDGNGFLDIIIVDEKQTVYVFDKTKNLLPGWPKQITNPITTPPNPPGNNVDYSEGHIAVADLNHDGKGEIAVGLLSVNGLKGGIYIWNYDGTPFTVNPFKEFADNERADGTIVFADIDNDSNLDLITTTRKTNSANGNIYAFKQDGTPVNAQWNGINTVTTMSSSINNIAMPKLAVGDLNHDGALEVVFGSSTKLYVLNKDGLSINSSFPKTLSDINILGVLNVFTTPILADIDTDSDAEIIINVAGKIQAYNIDGTLCTGFPIESESGLPFMSSPSIDDINNDGKNEMAISTKDYFTYIFKTNGHSYNNEWSSARGNPSNTGTYKEVCNNILDFCIKDGPDDRGLEPNTFSQYMWGSSDIWVRNNSNDNSLEHQNPKYRASGSPNHIKVRITNKSCVDSQGAESVTVFWAKASTGLGWYDPWHGGIFNGNGALMGLEVGTIPLPPMHKGEELVLDFPWMVPDPALYGTDGDQWHFCLLAQVNGGESDPLTFPLMPDLNQNVRNNNNLAWKNVTVVNAPVGQIEPGGVIAVANPFEISKTFYLEMAIADLETGKPIYDEAEVKIKMDDVLYRAWERGGKEAQLLDPTIDEKRKIVKGNHMILDNIAFLPNEIGTLKLSFNFLTRELTQKTNYVYHVIQKDAQNGEIIGGETFIINKNTRTPFEADAGPDKEVDLNQPITISADDINEPAIYNWYDNDGNLIFQGKDLQIASAVAKKYKLEVISTIDGFKDYSEVEVTLKPNRLSSIAPNPASDHVNVYYKVNEAASAYLMIVSYYMNGGISNNYVLDINSSETNIDLSNYPNGFYKVILVANGSIVDAKLLFKQ